MPDFQTIEQLIPNFADRVDDPPASIQDQRKLVEIFRGLLGQGANFIQPVLFRSGRLNVYAEAAVWGQHIQHRHERLLERCHGANLHVTEIKVKIRPDSKLQTAETIKRPRTFDPDKASQHLDKLAARLNSDTLADTVTRLAKRIRSKRSETENG